MFEQSRQSYLRRCHQKDLFCALKCSIITAMESFIWVTVAKCGLHCHSILITLSLFESSCQQNNCFLRQLRRFLWNETFYSKALTFDSREARWQDMKIPARRKFANYGNIRRKCYKAEKCTVRSPLFLHDSLQSPELAKKNKNCVYKPNSVLYRRWRFFQ